MCLCVRLRLRDLQKSVRASCVVRMWLCVRVRVYVFARACVCVCIPEVVFSICQIIYDKLAMVLVSMLVTMRLVLALRRKVKGENDDSAYDRYMCCHMYK